MTGVLLVFGPRRAVVFPGRRERESLYSDTTRLRFVVPRNHFGVTSMVHKKTDHGKLLLIC